MINHFGIVFFALVIATAEKLYPTIQKLLNIMFTNFFIFSCSSLTFLLITKVKITKFIDRVPHLSYFIRTHSGLMLQIWQLLSFWFIPLGGSLEVTPPSCKAPRQPTIYVSSLCKQFTSPINS